MNIKLRMLEKRDAPYMLEWMHDANVVEHLKNDFSSLTIADCERFILNSTNDDEDIHFAIVDEADEYLGTISLKHIYDKTAEFAIVIRKIAMGKGVSQEAMKKIFSHGFEVLKLNQIYWCVSKENQRAINFYLKNKYHKVDAIDDSICSYLIDNNFYNASELSDYMWFVEEKG